MKDLFKSIYDGKGCIANTYVKVIAPNEESSSQMKSRDVLVNAQFCTWDLLSPYT